MALATGEIRPLTGLRGIAAVVVMAYHYRNLCVTDPRLTGSLGPAYLMVDLFFVLSGFVMARTYGAAFLRGFSWPAMRHFLQARLARVYPLYAIIVLAMFVLVVLRRDEYPTHPLRALLTNLFLVQNLGSGLFCSTCSEEYILPAWSISTEAAAYILFPLLVAGALAGSRWRAAAFAACAAATLVLLSFIPFAWLHTLRRSGPLDISGGETLWSLVRCLAGFSLGLVTWRVAEANAARIARLGGAPDLLILALFAGLWWIHGTDIALVALFPPLILLLCSERSMLGRALGSPLPHRMGDWSYAIYLLHWPALTLMPALLPTIKATHLPHAWSATLALMAAFTLVLAALAHRFVERPARSALRSLMHRRRVPMALEPSAP